MARRSLFDVQHPFFIPMWRRVAVVTLCYGWALVELVIGSPFWVILFGALGVFCSYEFFFNFHPNKGDDAEEDK